MNRRDFLLRASLLAAGTAAAEPFGWTRRLFPAWGNVPVLYGDGVTCDRESWLAFASGRPVWDQQAGRMILGPEILYGRQFRALSDSDFWPLGFKGPPMVRGANSCIFHRHPQPVSVDRRWVANAERRCEEMGMSLRYTNIIPSRGPKSLFTVEA